MTERFRWRREESRRWDAKRLEALTAYASKVKSETRACLRVSAASWPGMTTNPLSIEEGELSIAQAEDQRSELFESLLLLADAGTVEAARVWQEKVWSLHCVMAPPEDMTRDDFLELFRLAGLARDEFYDAARRSLLISGETHRNPRRFHSKETGPAT
jgi:hypothetical protein